MSNTKHKVILNFPSESSAEDFCAWLSDGGGECGLMEALEYGSGIKARVNYSGCFEAWGWGGDGDRSISIEEVEG